MDNTTWNEVNSTLDLNGPILSYNEQPTGATGIGTTVNSTGGGSVSFTGIETGVDLTKICNASKFVFDQLGRNPFSRVYNALEAKNKAQEATSLGLQNLFRGTLSIYFFANLDFFILKFLLLSWTPPGHKVFILILDLP